MDNDNLILLDESSISKEPIIKDITTLDEGSIQKEPIIKNNLQGININVKDPEFERYKMAQNGSLEAGVTNSKGKPIILPNTLGNLKYIFQDILAGDKSAMQKKEFEMLGMKNMIKSLEWLAKTNNISDQMKALLATEGWRLTFRDKPPTPAEFLTPKYIGDQATTLHPWIRDTFIKYNDPLAPYRNLILSSCIGTGKSTLTVCVNLYTAALFSLMWAPYKYYGYAPSTKFTIVFGGFSQKKASQLLFEPMKSVLLQSEFFKQCRTEKDMIDANREFNSTTGVPNIYWTTATGSSGAEIQMSNGLNFYIVSSNGDIIGQNIVMGSCTELGFWREEGGWTDEQIYDFFTSLRARIDNRMHNNRISGFILDSSPNTMESVIDKWIWNDAPKSKLNYIFTGANWKFFKKNFEEALDEKGEVKHDWNVAFPLFKGGNGMLPRVIESPNDLTQFDPIDIIWCARKGANVSMIDMAKEQPIKFLKDWCGIPAGTEDRIFYNPDTIERCFDNNLRNIIGQITAPAEEEPEHLIWNQIRDRFFTKIVDKYYFYYEPGIPRTVSVDQSYAGDVTGISMTHVERDSEKIDPETGEPLKVFVTDFTIVIIPKGGIINLDAIKCFIWDLISLGNLNIKHVSYDGFQSESARQFLDRKGVKVEYVSVDRTNEPYLAFIDYVFHGRYYCGKNIYLKNNMKSIQMVKRKKRGDTKIDHMQGEIVTDGDGNWETDMRGINAKDSLDSVVASIELINRYSNEFVPYTVWKPNGNKSRDYDTMKSKSDELLESLGMTM